jgi:hypothetical protein
VGAVNRYTFVVQVHLDGITTLENLATRERVRVADLASVGGQIGRWLEALGDAANGGEGAIAPGPGEEER